MMNDVLISIIIPVYNSEKYLVNCIDSIITQNFNAFELLLVDDGSSDNSPNICDYYAKNDHRVRVFHNENMGICASRNFGLQKASGKYIAFSDHDDIVNQGFLKDNYILAEKFNADVVKFGCKSIIIVDNTIRKTAIRKFENYVLTKAKLPKHFSNLRFTGAMTCVWDGLFRSDLIKNNGLIFNTDYKKGGEDIEFCSLCMANANVIVFSDNVYYNHYIRFGVSTSTKDDPLLEDRLTKLLKNYYFCCKKLNDEKYSPSEIDYLVAVKNYIYPVLVDAIRKNKETSFMLKFIKKAELEIYHSNMKCIRMLSIDKKWGLMGILILRRKYRLLISLLRIYNSIFKSYIKKNLNTEFT